MHNINQSEINKFEHLADQWWEPLGKFAPLHKINPVRVEFMMKELDKKQGTLLDIGCGGGILSENMSRLGMNVTGIDPSHININIAKNHAQEAGLSDIEYIATESPSLQRQFDIVCAMEVAEHVPDPEFLIEEMLRLMKPNGIGFISTINRNIKSYATAICLAEYVLQWVPRGTHQWRSFITPSELCQMITNSGGSVCSTSGICFDIISNDWRLKQSDLNVNYIVSFQHMRGNW